MMLKKCLSQFKHSFSQGISNLVCLSFFNKNDIFLIYLF